MKLSKLYNEHKKVVLTIGIFIIVVTLLFIVKYIWNNLEPDYSIDSLGISDSNDTDDTDTDNMSIGKGDINNPLNIRTSSIKWIGKDGSSGDTFESFDTLQDGIKAAYSNLQTYASKYGLNTIRGIINRWAPASENPTNTYISDVVSWSGIDADTPLDGIEDYAKLISAMSKQEGNIFVPVSDVLTYIS